jgi:hypothetical protein
MMMMVVVVVETYNHLIYLVSVAVVDDIDYHNFQYLKTKKVQKINKRGIKLI